MQYNSILRRLLFYSTNKSNTTVKLIAISNPLSILLQRQITQFVNFYISTTIANISTIIRSCKDRDHLMLMALPISLRMNPVSFTYFHHPFMPSNNVLQGVVKKKLFRNIYSIHLTNSPTGRIPSLLLRWI